MSTTSHDAADVTRFGMGHYLQSFSYGTVIGLGGVFAANYMSPTFNNLKVAPVKLAVVLMSGIGFGSYFAEKKVTDLAMKRIDINGNQLMTIAPENHTWEDYFHQYKYQAVFGMWAASIAGSLLRSKGSGDRLWHRLIDARMFAQTVTIAAAIGLGVSAAIVPQQKSKYLVDVLQQRTEGDHALVVPDTPKHAPRPVKLHANSQLALVHHNETAKSL